MMQVYAESGGSVLKAEHRAIIYQTHEIGRRVHLVGQPSREQEEDEHEQQKEKGHAFDGLPTAPLIPTELRGW